MPLISLRALQGTLIRSLSGSAVRIALGATITTSHPAVAIRDVPAPVFQAAQPGIDVAANDGQAPPPCFAGPGPGWG